MTRDYGRILQTARNPCQRKQRTSECTPCNCVSSMMPLLIIPCLPVSLGSCCWQQNFTINWLK